MGAADSRARAPARARSDRRGRRARHQLRRADRRRGRARRGGRAADGERGDAAHDLLGHRGGDDRACASRARPRGASRSSSSRAPTTATPTACSRRPARASPRRGCPRARGCRRPPLRPRSSCRGTMPTRCIAATERYELAAIIAEPLPANMGLVRRRVAAEGGSSRCCASARTPPARCSCSTR